MSSSKNDPFQKEHVLFLRKENTCVNITYMPLYCAALFKHMEMINAHDPTKTAWFYPFLHNCTEAHRY